MTRGRRTYGRRVRRIRPNRLAQRRPSRPSRPRPATTTSDSQDVANLRFDYAAGHLRRVARSAYCDVLSPEAQRNYRDIVAEIAEFRREESQWRENEMKACREEATSHINTATSLTDVANAMEESQAKMLSDAARLLAKSANLLKTVTKLEKDYDMVFVYDIDEITMLSRNHIAEFVTMFPEIDSFSLLKLTENVLQSVNFSSEESENDDITNIYYATEDGSDYWEDMVRKYDALEVLYNETATGYREGDPAISQELCTKVGMGSEVQNLRKTVSLLQKRVHQRWRLAKKCLELVNKKSQVSPGKYANIVFSREGVKSGVAQILASGCAPFLPVNNLYSTGRWGRTGIFETLQKRFGESCVFVYVTSSPSTDIPDLRQIRHWPVEAADSIRKLYMAQKKNLLKAQIV